MTGLDLSGGEELSSSFEPCLRKAKRHQSKRRLSRCDWCLFAALPGLAHGTEAASLQVIKEHRQDDQ